MRKRGATIGCYALMGLVLGLILPITATFLDIVLEDLPPSLTSVAKARRAQPLRWAFITAPLFPGRVADFSGWRQDALARAAPALESLEADVTRPSAELASLPLAGSCPEGTADERGTAR